jgi:uncharacterized membrane protein
MARTPLMAGIVGTARMSPGTRRIVQALLYESIAVAIVTPSMMWLFDHPPGSALALSVVLSAVAMAWNYVFNALFERWEARQRVAGRSLARRIAHGLGFEAGLVILLVPIMAVWLDVSLLTAFIADLGLIAFFLVYTVVFTWVFDRVFGLPESAQSPPAPTG